MQVVGLRVPRDGYYEFRACGGEVGGLIAHVVVTEPMRFVSDAMLVQELRIPVAGFGLIEGRWIAPVGRIGQHMAVNGSAKLWIGGQHTRTKKGILGSGLPRSSRLRGSAPRLK